MSRSRIFRVLLLIVLSMTMNPISMVLAQEHIETTAAPLPETHCESMIGPTCPMTQPVCPTQTICPSQPACTPQYVCPTQATMTAPVVTPVPTAVTVPVVTPVPTAVASPVVCPMQTTTCPTTSHTNLATACLQAAQNTTIQNSTSLHTWEGRDHSSCAPRSIDLGSTITNRSAAFLGSRTVDITVGGSQLTVTSSSALTPAQQLAAIQVVRTGQQTVLLDEAGSAIGGSVTISSRMASHISDLIIPQGVSVTTISNTGTLTLRGDLNNNGSLLLGTRNPEITTLSLNANNITIGALGSVSTINLTGTGNLGLNLTATNNIVNAGTITTSGTLNMTAGGSIVNAMLPGQNIASTPLMQAGGNLSLLSGAGSITNAGLISSLNGSISIAAQTATNNLGVLANNGIFQAENGSIDIRDSAYTESANTTLTGGNYFSNSLNLYGGNGQVEVNIDQVSGRLTTSAQIAHVYADTPRLVLGEQCLTGDPTYANTGDIEIAGPITISGGAPLAIIAGGNIISTSANAQIINNGGSVLMIAGANIIGGSTGGASLDGTDPAGATTSDITVSLSGGAGGNIDFAALTPGCINCVATAQAVVIDTSSSTGPGGDITLVALANGSNGGNIWLSTSESTGDIYAFSSFQNDYDHMPGGTVTVFAGATSGTSIRLGDVYTSGNGHAGLGTMANSGPGTGSLNIQATQATTSDSNPLTINSMGEITSGNTIVPGALLNADIVAGVLNTAGAGGDWFEAGGNGGFLQIKTAGSVSSDSILSFGGGGGGNVFGSTISNNGGSGGDINVVADYLTVRGDINSSGGGGGSALSSPGTPVPPSLGGSAGDISIMVTSDVTVSPGRLGTGLILASSGGDGIDSAGAGAFGGGGGGSYSNGSGGSGATGGGAGGSDAIMGLIAPGGPGGGGGFNGSGGGGGGAVAIYDHRSDASGGGGGGGGDNGILDAGANSFYDGTLPPFTYYIPGQSGGGGGIGGGLPGKGGDAAFMRPIFGGNGGAGSSADDIGNGAGPANGGLSPIVEIIPYPGGNYIIYGQSAGSAGSGNDRFGLPRDGAASQAAGASTSPGVNGGNITINAKNTFVNGTISSNNSLFGGGSVLALGTGGSVTITGSTFAAGTVRATESVSIVTPPTTPGTSSFASLPVLTQSLRASPIQAVASPFANSIKSETNILDSQIGTRVATDYTPLDPMLYRIPLQGAISFEQTDITGQSVFSSGEFTSDELAMLASAGVKFGESSGGNFLDLIKGYVLFLPQKEIKVQTREGLVTVPAGAACWIMETGADVAVFDFHDSHSHPVKVEANNKDFVLSPGMQVLLTRNTTSTFNQLNPAYGAIGYRRLRYGDLGDGMRAYVCDFSIPHGLNNVQLIRNLLKSKEVAHKKSVNHMLKNALVLVNLTGYNYDNSAAEK